MYNVIFFIPLHFTPEIVITVLMFLILRISWKRKKYKKKILRARQFLSRSELSLISLLLRFLTCLFILSFLKRKKILAGWYLTWLAFCCCFGWIFFLCMCARNIGFFEWVGRNKRKIIWLATSSLHNLWTWTWVNFYGAFVSQQFFFFYRWNPNWINKVGLLCNVSVSKNGKWKERRRQERKEPVK